MRSFHRTGVLAGLAAILLAFFCVVLPGQVPAADFSVIDTDGLKQILDHGDRQFLLIDTRNPEEYQEVHIPQAVNIPEKKFGDSLSLLPADKNHLLILYCNGVKCGKSKRAAAKARDAGYGNLLIYAEGAPVWEERGLPIVAGPAYEKRIETTKIAPMDLQKRLREKPGDYQVVDVRDASEFAEGRIPGAVNIPVAVFSSRSGELDKDRHIVVYCNSGGRSYNAYRKLMQLGYHNFSQAIFFDWKEANLPVER